MKDEVEYNKRIHKIELKYKEAMGILNRKQQSANQEGAVPYKPTLIKLLKATKWVLKLNHRFQNTIMKRLQLPFNKQSISWMRRKILYHSLGVQLKSLQHVANSLEGSINKYENMIKQGHHKFGGQTRRKSRKRKSRKRKSRKRKSRKY